MLNRKMIFILVLLLFVPGVSTLFAQVQPVITWDSVSGAGGYIIEIRNSAGKTIVEKELSGTSYDISGLTPGNYSYKLTTLNKLKKRGASSGWIKITIEKAVIPKIGDVSQKLMSPLYSLGPFKVKGENFLPDSKLFLKNSSGTIELDTGFISPVELGFSFKTGYAVNGVYDIVVINRGGFTAEIKSAIEIISPDVPVLETVSKNGIYNSIESRLIIKGRNLDKDTGIIIRSADGRSLKFERNNISDSEIEIRLNPRESDMGEYIIYAVRKEIFFSDNRLSLTVLEKGIIPGIASVSRGKLGISYNNPEVVVKGDNFLNDTKLYLKNSTGIIDLKMKYVTESELRFVFSKDIVKAGIYDLVAENRGGFISVLKSAVELVPADVPVLESISREVIYYSFETRLVIKGRNLGPGTSIRISAADGRLAGFTRRDVSDSEIVIILLPRLKDKGDYSVSAVKNEIFTSPVNLKLRIDEPQNPVVERVTPGMISVARGQFIVKITGRNLDDKTNFELRKDGVILKPVKVVANNKSASLYFNERKYNEGQYNLYCSKGDYDTVIYKNALYIKDTSKGLLGMDVLFFGIGWSYGLPEGQWSDVLDKSVKGFNIFTSYPLSQFSLTGDIPVLKYLGVEMLLNYSGYRFVNGESTDSYIVMKALAGLNYSLPLSFISYDLSMVFNIDAGYAYSSMSILNEWQKQKYSSGDFCAGAGITMRYFWCSYIFTDLSYMRTRIFYVSDTLDESAIILRAGILL